MKKGDYIRKFRKERGLTQKELGSLCGMTEGRIGQYENGFRVPKSEVLQKIASALKVSYFDLLDDDDYTRQIISNIKTENEDVQRKLITKELDKINREIEQIVKDEERLKKELKKNQIQEKELLYFMFKQFNENGQDKIIDYIVDLSKLEKYTKD